MGKRNSISTGATPPISGGFKTVHDTLPSVPVELLNYESCIDYELRVSVLCSMEALSDNLFDKLDTHRLPSLDQVLIEILEACAQDKVSFDRLAEIIRTDSAMTVRILTIVNSPAYSLVQPVTTLKSALVNVGVDAIKTLAITASLRKVINGFDVGTDFDSGLYWKQSLFCGLMVKELAGLAGYDRTDEAYLVGLLHNVGELVIATNFPSEFQYCRMHDGNEKLIFEQKQFGFNHFAVGAWVVDQWRLHPFISDAIFYQQEPEQFIINSHILVRFLYLARQLNASGATPDPSRFDLAERMFGFSPSMVRNLIEKVNRSMKQIAQSMSIELPEVGSEAGSGPTSSMTAGEQAIFWPEENSTRLGSLVRDQALAESVNRLVSKTSNRRDFLNSIQACAYVLFGWPRTMLFVAETEKAFLTGFIAGEERDPTCQITVSLRDQHSGIARAFREKSPSRTWVHSKTSPISIVDRQTARLFCADGIYCIPVLRSGEAVAVLVSGAAETPANRPAKNPRLVRDFVSIVGANLRKVSDLNAGRPESDSIAENLRGRIRNLVHEVNNPLTVLKSYIAILGKKSEGAYHDEIRIVNDEIERIGRLIRQLSEEPRIDHNNVAVNELIADLLKIYRESYFIPQGTQVSFVPDAAVTSIEINSDAIKQVLTNLLRNAIEALGGSGEITIKTNHDVSIGGKRYLEILVADNGPGIPPEITDRLFDEPVSTKGTGRGFGLVIVKNLLKDMDGLIRVKPRKPHGVIFQLLLPVQK